MNRQPVRSSNVKAVGYDAATALLEIEYHNGSVYQYRGVSQAAYDALRAAPSVGGYLAAHIKPQYTAQRVKEATR